MVFCNKLGVFGFEKLQKVTILILIDGFLQYSFNVAGLNDRLVTILILIDGFLQ